MDSRVVSQLEREEREREEIDQAPGVMAGSVVPDENLEKSAGYIRLSLSSLSVARGRQPILTSQLLCASRNFSSW